MAGRTAALYHFRKVATVGHQHNQLRIHARFLERQQLIFSDEDRKPTLQVAVELLR